MPASKTRTRPGRLRCWVLRAALALIFVVNVQCALSFVLNPAAFADAYELTGAVGAAAVQGLGVTFLTWNATYPPVIAHPERHRTLFGVIVAQQAIGLVRRA